ncbi:POTRA domain-containing protein [Vulgatibacter sp.]|uniref:POTRA domain-containing protein n=1 Tax=Vulgatibacter sp. TaxID=1971226 RepID=UPI00356210CE
MRRLLLALALLLASSAASAVEDVQREAVPAAVVKEAVRAAAGDGWAEMQPALPPDAPLVVGVEILAAAGEETTALEPLVALARGERLSRRAVRRSVQRLYETGRYANVTATAHEVPGGVIVRFALEAKRPVAKIGFAGLSRLDEAAVRRAAGLREGVEFSEDRIDAAAAGIRNGYARVGYEQAQVDAILGGGPAGVEITFVVREGPPTRLAGIRFVGDPGDPALVRKAITLQPGAVLDVARLEAELDALRASYRVAGYYRSRVASPRVARVLPGLSEVEIEVRAGPRISFDFRGNGIFSDATLRDAMAWEGDELLDKSMVRDLAERIERTYRLAGWFDARVFTTEKRRDDELRVIFHVDEGRPLYIAHVDFDGNGGLSDATLQALFEQAILASRGTEPLLLPLARGELDAAFGDAAHRRDDGLDPLHVYDEELYAQVVEALRTRYQDEGFLEAEVDPALLSIDETRRVGVARIPIREGRRTRIARVEIPGASAIDTVAFLGALPALAPRMPLSDPRLREARLQLQALYAREGYLYASVEIEVERPEGDRYDAVVRLQVNEGPQVRAGRILVQGNTRTDPSVIEDALLFREGTVVGSEHLGNSQQRLMRLGIFRTAAIRPLDADVPEPVKDLVVDLRERPKRSLEVGGGLSIADGPRAFAEFTERNILGRNLEFGARARVNYQAFREEVVEMPFEEGLERYVDLGLRYPRIYGLPLELGWRLDLIHERDIRPAYGLTKFSLLTGVDWPASSWLQAVLLLEVESNTTARSAQIDQLYGELSRRDLERLRFPEGNTLLGSVRPGLVLDLRDDPVAPQAGLLAKVESDFARSLLDDPVEFIKVAGSVTGYVPLARRTSIALSVGGGRIFQLNENSETIWPKRFFLGGAGSMRGFSEDGVVPEDRRQELRGQIADCKALVFGAGCTDAARFLQQGQAVPSDGGDLYLLARGELRFPIRGDLMGGVFVDAGNLWLDTSRFDPMELRPTSGVGLRYATPVGPVALDLGVNLDPDEALNEDPFALHFSIGLF